MQPGLSAAATWQDGNEMAWEDDDSEDESGPVAIARALSASEEAEPPDQVPDVVARTQDMPRDAEGEESHDQEAQSLANYNGEEEPRDEGDNGGVAGEIQAPAGPSDASPEDQGLAALSGGGQVTAPKPPVFQSYSQEPVEAAHEYAQAKSDFASKVAAGAYKPSGWRQLGAALSGGLVAFGSRNPAEGMRVAEAADKAPLNRATAAEQLKEQSIQARQQAGNAANDVTQRNNQNQASSYNLADRNMRNQAYANDQNAQAADRNAKIVDFKPNDPTNPYAGGTATRADGKVLPNSAPPDDFIKSWVKTPQGQQAAARMSTQTRTQTADAAGLKGEERSQFIATGKIVKATQVHVPSAQQEQYNDWKTQYRKENGHDPDAASIWAFGHSAKGELTENERATIENKKDDAISKSRDAFEDGTKTKEEYLNDWQAAQDKFENDIKASVPGSQVPHVVIRDNVDPNTLEWHGKAPASPAGGPQGQTATTAPPNGSQRPAAPAQAPQQAAQQSETPPKATTPPPKGATGRVKGSDGNWYWIAGNKVIGRS